MDWIKHYNLLIAKRQLSPPADDEYVEVHHIIPRCMKGTNAPTNLIRLTPEDHFFCHVLLAKAYDLPKLWAAVKVMTAKGGGGETKYTRIRKMYGLSRRMTSEKLKGKGHPAYNHTIYHFVNEKGDSEHRTQHDFGNTFGISKPAVCSLVKGKVKDCRGWALYSKTQEPGFFWGRATGSNASRADKVSRRWKHKDGDEFEGMTLSLAATYNLPVGQLSAVARGSIATSQGWHLADRFSEHPTASTLKSHLSDVISIKHVDGRTLENFRPIVMKQAGLTHNDIFRLVNGKRRQSHGWMLSTTELPTPKSVEPSIVKPKLKRLFNVSHATKGMFEGDLDSFNTLHGGGMSRQVVRNGIASLITCSKPCWHGWVLSSNVIDGVIKPKALRKSKTFAHLIHPQFGEFDGNASDFADKYTEIDTRPHIITGFSGLVRGRFLSWRGWTLLEAKDVAIVAPRITC